MGGPPRDPTKDPGTSPVGGPSCAEKAAATTPEKARGALSTTRQLRRGSASHSEGGRLGLCSEACALSSGCFYSRRSLVGTGVPVDTEGRGDSRCGGDSGKSHSGSELGTKPDPSSERWRGGPRPRSAGLCAQPAGLQGEDASDHRRVGRRLPSRWQRSLEPGGPHHCAERSAGARHVVSTARNLQLP